ncbi:MAG: KamA family radical SAM protein [Desulfobulbus sp.]
MTIQHITPNHMGVPASSLVTDPRELSQLLDIPYEQVAAVHARYPVRVSRYYLELAKQHGTPLLKQIMPDVLELEDNTTPPDPLDEENLSPTPCLIHKYPDRAVLLVSKDCASYCRFCTRKRKVGTGNMVVSPDLLNQAIAYIRNTPAIADVLISGGDPFMLSDQHLEHILHLVRSVPTVRIIRIGTRMPCMLPSRITSTLAALLRKFHPLFINLHFNHPAELTTEARAACAVLADAGIPLGCQTVLLRGVNDSAPVLQELFYHLLAARVKPYYLFQADLTRGASHFRTSIDTGQDIMRQLIGQVSGMAIPTYALDTPGGGGKIPLAPNYVHRLEEDCTFTTYTGTNGVYPNTVWPENDRNA